MVSVSDSELPDTKVQHEVEALQAYALRWSVLAAWRSELLRHKVPMLQDTSDALERARIKLASGCFSACEVGCDLSTVEAGLMIADASQELNAAGFWLDLLAQAMTEQIALDQFLKIPAIQFHYQNCGISGCTCQR